MSPTAKSKKANLLNWRKSNQAETNDEKPPSSPGSSEGGLAVTPNPATPPQLAPVSFFSLFRYVNYNRNRRNMCLTFSPRFATKLEIFLDLIGVLSAVCAGAAQVIQSVVFIARGRLV